jgi:hypothetical protein
MSAMPGITDTTRDKVLEPASLRRPLRKQRPS